MADPDLDTLLALAAEADALLTPRQRLEVAIGEIRHYAFQHSLSGRQVLEIFEAGTRGRFADATQAEAA